MYNIVKYLIREVLIMAENEIKKEKIYGLNIAALVLGIVSIVTWCLWFISIPCAILSLIFGIIGIKKVGKAMAITGIITGAVTLVLWVLIFSFAFIYGFIDGINESRYKEFRPIYHSSFYEF